MTIPKTIYFGEGDQVAQVLAFMKSGSDEKFSFNESSGQLYINGDSISLQADRASADLVIEVGTYGVKGNAVLTAKSVLLARKEISSTAIRSICLQVAASYFKGKGFVEVPKTSKKKKRGKIPVRGRPHGMGACGW